MFLLLLNKDMVDAEDYSKFIWSKGNSNILRENFWSAMFKIHHELIDSDTSNNSAKIETPIMQKPKNIKVALRSFISIRAAPVYF